MHLISPRTGSLRWPHHPLIRLSESISAHLNLAGHQRGRRRPFQEKITELWAASQRLTSTVRILSLARRTGEYPVRAYLTALGTAVALMAVWATVVTMIV
jgi:hypothetical protein